MKKWVVSIMILTVVLGLTACGGTGDQKVLKVGMEAGYPPFNWTQINDSNGAVKISGQNEYAGGYDVQIAKILAEKMGKTLEIQKIEWDGLTPAVQSGTIDLIIAGMSPTEQRKEVLDFSDVYYKSDLVVVIKKGSKYEGAKTLQDLSGAKITAQLNTFHYTVIDQIPGVAKESAMDNFPAMRVALQSGIIDGYVSEKPEAISAAAANPDFSYIVFEQGFVTSEEDTAIAVGMKKNSPLKDEINKILSQLTQTERDKLMEDAIKQQPAETE